MSARARRRSLACAAGLVACLALIAFVRGDTPRTPALVTPSAPAKTPEDQAWPRAVESSPVRDALEPQLAELTLAVHDRATGAPIAGAVVRHARGAETTDGAGRVVLPAPDGAFIALAVEADGFLPFRGTIANAQAPRVDLHAESTIAGTVVDERGAPVSGASLALLVYGGDGKGARASTLSSKQDGAFAFAPAQAGERARLTVTSSRYLPWQRELSVGPETRELEVVVEQGLRLWLDLSEYPELPESFHVRIAGAAGVLRDSPISREAIAALADPRRVPIGAVRPGEYDLTLEADGLRVLDEHVAIAASRTFVVRAPAGARELEVSVSNELGEPIRGANVVAQGAGLVQAVFGSTDALGRCTLALPRDTRLSVLCAADGYRECSSYLPIDAESHACVLTKSRKGTLAVRVSHLTLPAADFAGSAYRIEWSEATSSVPAGTASGELDASGTTAALRLEEGAWRISFALVHPIEGGQGILEDEARVFVAEGEQTLAAFVVEAEAPGADCRTVLAHAHGTGRPLEAGPDLILADGQLAPGDLRRVCAAASVEVLAPFAGPTEPLELLAHATLEGMRGAAHAPATTGRYLLHGIAEGWWRARIGAASFLVEVEQGGVVRLPQAQERIVLERPQARVTGLHLSVADAADRVVSLLDPVEDEHGWSVPRLSGPVQVSLVSKGDCVTWVDAGGLRPTLLTEGWSRLVETELQLVWRGRPYSGPVVLELASDARFGPARARLFAGRMSSDGSFRGLVPAGVSLRASASLGTAFLAGETTVSSRCTLVLAEGTR